MHVDEREIPRAELEEKPQGPLENVVQLEVLEHSTEEDALWAVV